MNNGNETLGLTVISTIPNAHETCVNVNTSIEITFSGDINKSSLNNSIIVFEDINGIYNGATSLKDSSKYNIVTGTLSYANRVIKFTPTTPLKPNMKYIIVLNNTIMDITGLKMLKKYIFAFNTEVTASYGQCIITEPSYGKIFTEFPEIKWQSLDAPSYIIQISKVNTFESLVYESFITSSDEVITHKPDFNYKEGVYYIRIKAEGGQWSDVNQLFIKEITDAIVALEDQSDEIYLDDFLDGLEDELEVLEVFPKDESISNSLKTNIFYVKLKGIISPEKINIKDCFIESELCDEDDDITYLHENVTGNWSVIQDTEYDCTYVILDME